MKLYRVNPKTGFMETIETDGNYKPPGWYETPGKAAKNKNRKVRKSKRHN